MSSVSRIIAAGLTGIVFFLSACKNENAKVQQQHGKDTNHVAVDTIFPSIEKYTKRISSNPKDANAYWGRGKLEVSQKSFSQALADYEQAIQIDSNKDQYYYSLADLYFMIGRTRDSKTAFEKCISVNPGNTDALLKLGEIYFYVKKYKEAMDLADKALKADVHLARAYFMKGLLFLEIHDTTKALSSMQTAVEQNTQYFDAYIQLGLIYAHRHDAHAVDYFNAALNIAPQSLEPYYDKGMFYQSVSDYDNAVRIYNQLLQIDSTYKFALYNMGYIYYITGKDYNKAIYYFSKTVQSDTAYTMAYYARGNCYEEVNDLPSAAADFARALKQKPDFKEAEDSYKEVREKLHK
ncbi:MAG: tetratricopeptide repeat protein [Bacteroidia bacterium]